MTESNTNEPQHKPLLSGLIQVDIGSALGFAVLALACYQEGDVWRSGFCAGAAFATLLAVIGVART